MKKNEKPVPVKASKEMTKQVLAPKPTKAADLKKVLAERMDSLFSNVMDS